MKRIFLVITFIVSVGMALIPAGTLLASDMHVDAREVIVTSDPDHWRHVLADITKRMSDVMPPRKVDSLYYGKAQITSEIIVKGKPVALSREYG